jgi:hypothetical protein
MRGIYALGAFPRLFRCVKAARATISGTLLTGLSARIIPLVSITIFALCRFIIVSGTLRALWFAKFDTQI